MKIRFRPTKGEVKAITHTCLLQTHRVPASCGSHILRQLVHEGCKVVSPRLLPLHTPVTECSPPFTSQHLSIYYLDNDFIYMTIFHFNYNSFLGAVSTFWSFGAGG